MVLVLVMSLFIDGAMKEHVQEFSLAYVGIRIGILALSGRIHLTEPDKRPVNAVADHVEFKSVQGVSICEDQDAECLIMFDADHSWDERILAEQFRY